MYSINEEEWISVKLQLQQFLSKEYALNMSQAQFSSIIGVSQGTLSEIEQEMQYENEFLLRIWKFICSESERISEEAGTEVNINEVSAMISKDLTIMFNSRLTPEEDDLLNKYRLITPNDKKNRQGRSP